MMSISFTWVCFIMNVPFVQCIPVISREYTIIFIFSTIINYFGKAGKHNLPGKRFPTYDKSHLSWLSLHPLRLK